jgi:DNA polymerase-3 subunit delta
MAAKAAAKTDSPLVLITGDDDFGVGHRARELYQKWQQDSGGFDNEIIDAGAANASEALKALDRLTEALQTIPFFGSTKVLWFKGCNFLAENRTANAAAVTERLANLAQFFKEFDWQGVRLIISAPEVDKRRAFYKAIEKTGAVETFAGWSYDTKDWAMLAEIAARQQLRSLKKEISDEALAQLVADVGPNNRQLANEVEKLALYCGERPEVEKQDVDAIVSKAKGAKAFALGDALGARDLPRLMRTLESELWMMETDSEKSEIGILFGLISKVRTMLFLREMLRESWIKPTTNYATFKAQLDRCPRESFPEDRRFNPLSMHPYMLFNSLAHAQQYASEELVQAMELLLRCNLSMISSDADDALLLQQTLIRIATRNPAPSEGRVAA